MTARTPFVATLALAALAWSRTARAQAVPDAPLESFSLVDGTELRGYLAARESDGTLSVLLLDGSRRTITRGELYERRPQRAHAASLAPTAAPASPWVRVTVALTPPAPASEPPASPPDKPATPASNSVLYAVASGVGALTSLALTAVGYDAWQHPGARGSGTPGLFAGGAVTLLTTTALTVGFSLDARRGERARERRATLSVAGAPVARW